MGQLQQIHCKHPFNSDLAKKPPECLEYILVHEMAHLLESTHNSRFTALMDRFVPGWRQSQGSPEQAARAA
jgi:predicted metal-dependent hydrolase